MRQTLRQTDTKAETLTHTHTHTYTLAGSRQAHKDTGQREREAGRGVHSLMLGCPAHIRSTLTSRMVSLLVCSMVALSAVFSPLMSMIFTAYSLCVAFSTTRRTVLLMPL